MSRSLILIVGDAVIARCDAVRRHAYIHRRSLSEMMRMMNQPERAVGNDPNFVVHIHDGWKVVYSIEQQPEPLGWCEHLSVSLSPSDGSKAHPSFNAVKQMILPLFHLKMENIVKTYVEEVPDESKQEIGHALFKYVGGKL